MGPTKTQSAEVAYEAPVTPQGKQRRGLRVPAALVAVFALAGCRLPIGDPVHLPTPGPGATPMVPPPTTPPTVPPTPQPCASLEGDVSCHESMAGVGSEMDDAVNAAISAACLANGAECDPMSGPPRPGTWQSFVWLVGSDLQRQGLVATYDYEHGEDGRASEMSIRRCNGTRVFNYQIETSAGRVRRPKGAYRGYCDNAEGQPLRRAE